MADRETSLFLASALADVFRGVPTLAIGANSPIPAAAALLAQRREPSMRVSILGSPAHNPYTNGGGELFDYAAEGRLACFVLGALQIDGAGNLNLVSVGDYDQPTVRYPGSFGSGLLYSTVPRVVVFREDHSPRALVDKVDFVSATGTSPPGVYRPGGPAYLVTGKAVFRFDRECAQFALQSVHPGHTRDEVIAATGFRFARADGPAPVTSLPSEQDRRWLTGPIADALLEGYPEFARLLMGD